MNLSDPVTTIPFIGEKHRKLLRKLDIKTVEDLLRHYPTRYEDLSTIKKISELVAGEKATIRAEVLEIKNIRTKYGKLLTKARVSDKSGTLLIVWFNQPYLINTIRAGNLYSFSGELKSFSGRPAFLGPEYERTARQLDSGSAGQQSSQTANQQNSKTREQQDVKISEYRNKEKPPGRQSSSWQADKLASCPAVPPIHTGRLVPIYPETAGVSSKWLRSRISCIIHKPVYGLAARKSDPLPETIKKKYHLINLDEALRKIHFPQDQAEIREAKKRLTFEEMFLLQLRALKKRQDWKEQQSAVSISTQSSPKALGPHRSKQTTYVSKFIESLPFELTKAQKRCIDEILSDLEKSQPMNRLLQGDVGSGKTVVAAAAAYITALNGYQTAYMAPTEILAQQVFEVFKKYLDPFGIEVSLQTSSTKSEDTKYGDVLIGTHALLHRPELFNRLALVIIDEQHRFGVKQRGKLLNQNAKTSGNHSTKTRRSHLLTMTATPIPRSLALTTYGHLDISIIDEMPPGIKSTKTWLVPEEKREAGYRWIKRQLSVGNCQAFVICPLIKESEHETLEDVKAVTTEFERLKRIFPEFKLGLLHGKMKNQEKEQIVGNFRAGKTRILVSTPVVEVGIDIPQANIIIIEGAHRFGLASLHQLRGRVGRAGQESYCLLFTPKQTKRVIQRLKALEKNHSGLKLAELDLKMRGPGELYGVKQHGFPDLKIASLSDLGLIRAARAAAEEIITEIERHPKLKERVKIEEVAPN